MSGRYCFRNVVVDVRFGILYAKHSYLCVPVCAYKQCIKLCPGLGTFINPSESAKRFRLWIMKRIGDFDGNQEIVVFQR